MRFIDLEKVHDRVNREDLRQVVRIYELRGKLLDGIKHMYDDSLSCVRLTRGERKNAECM